VWTGKFNVLFFAGTDKIETWEFELERFDEYLPKTDVARVVAAGPTASRSPKLTKNASKQRQHSKVKGLEVLTMNDFTCAPIIQDCGAPKSVVQFLEVSLLL